MPTPLSRRISLATGLTYHVLEWGGDDLGLDHTVVLVHGFLDLAWGWRRTVDAGLAGRFHVVAPDMRGHGDSDRIGAGGYYHFFDYLADLHSLVAQLGRKRVSLVGHSMGGSIVGYYAGTYPDAIDRLALLEGIGPPESSEPGPARLAAWLAGWRRVQQRGQRSYATVAEAAARLRANDPLLSDELALELAQAGTVSGPDGRLRFKHDPLHATRGPYPYRVAAAQEFWTRVTCPVLLVQGSESQLRHPESELRRRYECFGTRREAVLQAAGHMMQRHQPQALAILLAEFLAESP
jgi:pimeloyl-ACP methyl ester carboxylesterase